MAKRRLPNREEALAGVLPVLQNAIAHRDAADALATVGQYGFAVAHLVYALEESEKARTLAKLAMGVEMSDEDVRGGLYEHKGRHVGAMTKSLSSGGAVIDYVAETVRERVGLRAAKTDAERWAMIDARHPEILPKDWLETAGAVRERNLYVDLRGSGWSGPPDTTAAVFERLRPAVTNLLMYLEAAHQREIVPLYKPDVARTELPSGTA